MGRGRPGSICGFPPFILDGDLRFFFLTTTPGLYVSDHNVWLTGDSFALPGLQRENHAFPPTSFYGAGRITAMGLLALHLSVLTSQTGPLACGCTRMRLQAFLCGLWPSHRRKPLCDCSPPAAVQNAVLEQTCPTRGHFLHAVVPNRCFG